MPRKFPSFSDVHYERPATEIQQSKSGAGTSTSSANMCLCDVCCCCLSQLVVIRLASAEEKALQRKLNTTSFGRATIHRILCQQRNNSEITTTTPAVNNHFEGKHQTSSRMLLLIRNNTKATPHHNTTHHPTAIVSSTTKVVRNSPLSIVGLVTKRTCDPLLANSRVSSSCDWCTRHSRVCVTLLQPTAFVQLDFNSNSEYLSMKSPSNHKVCEISG